MRLTSFQKLFRSLFVSVIMSMLLFPLKSNGQNVLTNSASASNIETALTNNIFDDIKRDGGNYWQDSIPQSMREAYIKLGLYYSKNLSWNNIPAELFSQFRTTGNRYNYEKPFMEHLTDFATIAMAEIIERKGQFTHHIIDGINYFLNQTWWGLPAHYPLAHPEKDLQVVDLYNSETASMLAWCCFMLKDELPDSLVKKVKREINRRLLVPARTSGILSWTDHQKQTSNWNPWICENWMACILLSDESRATKAKDIYEVLRCLDIFIDAYPEDGYCDEGPGYWNRSVGATAACLIMLDRATDGKVNLLKSKKLKSMSDYINYVYIGGNYFLNFGDAQPTSKANLNVVFPTAYFLNDQSLLHFAAFLANQNKYFTNPTYEFTHDGSVISIGRELSLLSIVNNIKDTRPELRSFTDYYFGDNQVLMTRKAPTFYVAIKGGNNNEHHNHNDVGNFVVYANSRPLIIDLGVQTYDKSSFDSQRYTLMSTRSLFHNVPFINGEEQKSGAIYKANNTTYNADSSNVSIRMDLADAYGNQTGVSHWLRTITVSSRNEINIVENYSLSRHSDSTYVTIMTQQKPSVRNKSSIYLSNGGENYLLSYNHKEVSAYVVPVTLSDNTLKRNWGETIYKIMLIVPPRRSSGVIHYSIKTAKRD